MNSRFDMIERAFHSAWGRMVQLLFQPFSPRKWFGLAFAAWVASLSQGSGGASSLGNLLFSVPLPSLAHLSGSAGPLGLFAGLSHWVHLHLAFTVIAVVLAAIAGAVLYLIFLWLDSRGRFVFLHCVAANRVEIRLPWRECEDVSNSLFLWRLMYSVAVAAVFGILLAAFLAALFLVKGGTGTVVLLVLAAGLVSVPLLLVVGAVSIFLDAFVVPLMYRYRFRATAAWGYFLRLLRGNLGAFVLYLAAALALRLGVATLLLLLSPVLMVFWLIPFASTVILLPKPIFFRCFSVYFLEQFHVDYRIMDYPAVSGASHQAGGGVGPTDYSPA